MPSNFEFDFIEVDNNDEKEDAVTDDISILSKDKEVATEEKQESDEEFEFPLFAAPPPNSKAEEPKDDTSMDVVVDEERGRTKSKIMKVSLREESLEVIKNERPLSYYYASYSEDQKRQFLEAAVSGDDIYQQIQISVPIEDPKPWKCLVLESHNAQIEKELAKQKKRSHSKRAGKKKREYKVACRERKLERKRIEKKLQKEKDAKFKKQFYGQKAFKPKSKRFNLNKTNSSKPQASKPKYKTE